MKSQGYKLQQFFTVLDLVLNRFNQQHLPWNTELENNYPQFNNWASK